MRARIPHLYTVPHLPQKTASHPLTDCKSPCYYSRTMPEITLKVENLVTFTEAAKILGVSRPTVYNLIARLKLHPLTIGRNRYLLREELAFAQKTLLDAARSSP